MVYVLQETSRRRKTMQMEVLYFDGCPTYRTAENTDEEARRLRYPGSPTIRVDGEDLFPVPDRTEYALGCRMYATAEGLKGSPTAMMLRAALAERNLVPGVS